MLKLALSAHSRLLFSTSVKETSPRCMPAPLLDCHVILKPMCSVKNLSALASEPPEGIIGVTERKTDGCEFMCAVLLITPRRGSRQRRERWAWIFRKARFRRFGRFCL